MPSTALRHGLAALAIALALGAASRGAAAHDTWFAPLGDRAGSGLLSLATGTRYPTQQIGIDPRYIVERGCRSADGRRATLSALQVQPTALLMRAAVEGAPALDAPTSCWAQLAPLEIEIDDAIVAIYLDEVNAPPAVRETWARLQARGVRWKERYVKHARIELRGAAPAPLGTPAPQRTPMGMDVLLEGGGAEIHPGDALRLQVLRDGAPLPDFAVELRGPTEAGATWLKTDAQGRASVAAPAPGRWLLRGTEIRPSTREPDAWESRFVTLAFEVLAP